MNLQGPLQEEIGMAQFVSGPVTQTTNGNPLLIQ